MRRAPSPVLYSQKQDIEAGRQVSCAFRHKDLQIHCHCKTYHILIGSRMGLRPVWTDGQSARDPDIFMHSL